MTHCSPVPRNTTTQRPARIRPFGLLPAALLGALFVASAAPQGVAAADGFLIRNHDRVVFYGDSITDTEWYPTLVEAYVVTRFPEWRNQFSNRGVSGDNSGSIKRFVRDVIDQHPNVVTYNMGYNDGGSDTLTTNLLEHWLANIEESVALLRKASDPKVRIVLAAPIVNELAVSKDPRWVSRESYPYTLLMFGQEEGRLAERLGTGFIDLGRLYGQTMGLGEVIAGPTFCLSRDGVHPQPEGQTFIAYHFLRAMGADPLLASLSIDAEKARVLEASRCKVRDLTMQAGVLSFRRVCEALPFPIPAVARPFAFLVQIDDTLSRDMLRVTGLSAPSYALSIDGRPIAVLSTRALEAGVNLSAYATTPMQEQAQAVLQAVRRKDVLEVVYWRQFIVAGKADGCGQPLASADTAARAEMDAARRQIADAEAACYATNTPQTHLLSLAPCTNAVSPHEGLVSAALNQAHVAVTIAPLVVDWSTGMALTNDVAVTVVNQSATPKAGTIRWENRNGWTMSPAEAPFAAAPGRSETVHFGVTRNQPGQPIPSPVATVRWPWSSDWAYPMVIQRSLELQPVLTIKPATTKVTLDGDLADWADATSFALDQISHVDPAVPGKRLLWGGPADLSAQVFLKWDADALYLAALVHDADHIQHESDMMIWSQDMLHVAAWMLEPGRPDGRYEFGLGVYSNRDAVVKFMKPAGESSGPDIQFKSRLNAEQGTCAYEVIVPWARLAPFVPQAGKRFRFTLAVSDADPQPGKGFNYLEWTPGIDYGKNPADFAHIVLGAP